MENTGLNKPAEKEFIKKEFDGSYTFNSPLEEESKKSKNYNRLALQVAMLIFILVLGSTLTYICGYKEAENKYKNINPKLHIFLTPSNGPTTAIPVTLTKNGVGIKFQNSLTNIIAIGIEEVEKRN